MPVDCPFNDSEEHCTLNGCKNYTPSACAFEPYMYNRVPNTPMCSNSLRFPDYRFLNEEDLIEEAKKRGLYQEPVEPKERRINKNFYQF
ncbi:MAG: hypothetical protein NC218_02100 [Acetobacter sp.]|nr:hypothetical protein [Acetobacter sp.]